LLFTYAASAWGSFIDIKLLTRLAVEPPPEEEDVVCGVISTGQALEVKLESAGYVEVPAVFTA